jgi:hypothetical protein
MPRRRQLKGIAFGIASSFVSRNNDVDGYWGLGIFYKLAKEAGLNRFALNLVTGESVPTFKYSKRVAKPYHDFLMKQLNKQGFNESQVKMAIVNIDFNVTPTKKQIIFKATWGEAFACRVHLTDDRGTVWSSEYREWCGIHNPKKELRSTRRYAS